MKKNFNKDDKNFENCTKCWIYQNVYVDCDFEVRNHCHINGKYRCSTQRVPYHILQPKKLSHASYYARTRRIRFYNSLHTKNMYMYELQRQQ